MKYAILIYADERERPVTKSPQEMEAMTGAFAAYTEALRAAGVMAGGAPLETVKTATTIRVRDGQRSVQDGPFADTKEQLAGFYLIETPDLDSALEWAARCPGATFGSVEVRPLMVFDNPPPCVSQA